MSEVTLDLLVSLAKRRGFIFPGSDVYGGLSGTWDYGPLGIMLKRNLINLWWKFFIDQRDDIYPLDAAILMNAKVWQASGHVETFTDPLVECRVCHWRFRADKVNLDKCPQCGQEKSFTEPQNFNLMFKTNIGPVVEDTSSLIYLRPETAQGIFTNYKNVLDVFYPDLPFGIGQSGKAFRNEISPRDFIFRSREFEQLEIEYFIDPRNWQDSFNMWLQLIRDWCDLIGLPTDMIIEREIDESDRAHYSQRTVDFEFKFPIGQEELLGLAYRTDFDLKNIERVSKKSMLYRPKNGEESFLPHVIEPSFGVERAIMAVLTASYKVDEVNGKSRTFLKLSNQLAPYLIVVGPLVKNKVELVAKAKEIFKSLKLEFGSVMWDDNSNIGKRYRRADEIGTPYCVTIDFDTLENGTVTVRDRDSTKQERLKVDEISSYIK